jgi:Xaa-Pro dipeptidase
MMCLDRRTFLRLSAGVAGGMALAESKFEAGTENETPVLGSLAGGVTAITPITDDERRARIEKAQRLMVEQRIDAIFLESGSSLFYYTGVRWGASERMFAAVIPARGSIRSKLLPFRRMVVDTVDM